MWLTWVCWIGVHGVCAGCERCVCHTGIWKTPQEALG